MIKAELVMEIAHKTGQTRFQVLQTVNTLLDIIKEKVANRQTIYLRGFGSFQTKHRAKRIARNITKNRAIVVEAYNFPRFKPCKDFMDQVKKRKGATNA